MAVNQNLTITQVSQSIANRTSTIRILWTTTQTGTSYNNYSKDGTCAVYLNGSTAAYKTYSVSSTLPKQSTKTILDTTLVVNHDSSGECVVSVRTSMATGLNAGTITLSESLTLEPIYQASILTASDGILGKAQTLSITRYDSGFTHSIRYDCGTASGAVCTKVNYTDVSFTPPIGLAKQNTAGSTVSVKLTLYTFNGDTEIGQTTKTISCTIPADVKPSCSITYEEAGTNHIQEYGALIQGQSRLQITVTPTLAYDSPIVSYTSTANGSRYSSSSYITGVLKNSGDMVIYAAVTDSRNRSGTKEITIPGILEYSAPAITSLSVHRCDADGTENDQGEYCQVSFTGFVHPLEGMNACSYEVKYKKTSDAVYTVNYPNLDDRLGEITYSYIFEADSGSPYDVVIEVTDDFNTATRSTSVSTAETIMHISADGSTVCFGGISTKTNAHQIRKPIYDRFDKVIGNGLATYESSMIDANTTLEHIIITTSGTPDTSLWYVITFFYNAKSESGNRAQVAIPYRWAGPIQHRYRVDGVWSEWIKNLNEKDEHTHPYATTAGGFRFAQSWLGLYDSVENAGTATNRKGWLGYNNTNVTDGAGGGIDLKSSSTIRMYGGGTSSFIGVLGDRLKASANDTYYLGDSSNKWKSVYAVNGTIQTSDKNLKTDIQEIDQKYIDLFDRLTPVSFRFTDGDRVHIGFISQDVKAAMDDVGISDTEFAAFCRDVKIEYDEKTGKETAVVDDSGNPVFVYSLRYSEFISLNSKMIQLNRQKIANQDREIQELREKIQKIESLLNQ